MDPVMGTPKTERCPRPLYSGHSHRKVTPSLTIIRVESSGMIILMLKKSIKEDEEYGVMEEFFRRTQGCDEPPNTRNPPERCPRPLYSGIPHRKVTPSHTVTRVEIQSI
ncbi:unnamed protein product [Staurois parvus]|uniref:Uncharacterized protein n=1 Tax=Staurois parvus TaxID=386267 RepID=A0ABN9AUB6_9NEOB|nr:unnamed protein product [Staurois parvus]